MDLERSLETQRVKLLRLMAGWVAVLGVLTFGPVALPAPRWVRACFDAVLTRAELATQFLVRASALMHGADGLMVSPLVACARKQQDADVPSAQVLFARMEALRDVLTNLPRYARRLLRVRKQAGEAFDFTEPSRVAPARVRFAGRHADWTAPRIERPPDKSLSFDDWLCAHVRFRTGGVGVTDRDRGLRLTA